MQILKFLEDKQRGAPGFPVELYHIGQGHPRYVMPLHWHEECELLRVRSGRFDYEIGGVRGAATAGDVLFINSGLLHGGMPQNCVYQCIVFSMEALLLPNDACRPALAAIAGGGSRVRLRLPPDDAGTIAVANRLFEALARQAPGFMLQARGLLYQFFGRVLEMGYTQPAPKEEAGGAKKIRRLKNALALIENSYAQPLTLSQLARAAGMSPKYFCRAFQELTRRTPMDYLNHHRIEAARTLLARGAQSVTEVAYECGFNDLSYFIRVFRRYAGTTPKRYSQSLAAAQ